MVPNVPTAKITENKCFICGANSRKKIPSAARIDIWRKKNIYISYKNRSCPEHLTNKIFNDDAADAITAYRSYAQMEDSEISKFLNSFAFLENPANVLSFDDLKRYSDESFYLLVGTTKEQFEYLHQHVCCEINNTKTRSSRNALAIFLMKLRLNLSQAVLSVLFNIKNQCTISRIIKTVMKSLKKNFVPKYHGYNHISREDILQKHSSDYFSKMLNTNDDNLVLILDGTYFYIEKPSNQKTQRKTFSPHKHRNLFKSMFVVCPDGYIVAAEGLFYGDGDNNDAKILQSMLKAKGSICSKMTEGTFYLYIFIHCFFLFGCYYDKKLRIWCREVSDSRGIWTKNYQT